MNIDALVVEQALLHIKDFKCVKNMDPMLLHVLKTSDRPLVKSMRDWMWSMHAYQQEQAAREQKKMNEEFAREGYSRKSLFRRRAVLHPYYATRAVRDGHPWGDQKFLGYVQKNNPQCFPKREAR